MLVAIIMAVVIFSIGKGEQILPGALLCAGAISGHIISFYHNSEEVASFPFVRKGHQCSFVTHLLLCCLRSTQLLT